MRTIRTLIAVPVAALVLVGGAWTVWAEEVPPEVDVMEVLETPIAQHDFEKGTLEGAPTDDLPDHITQLPVTLPDGKTAQRADWSPDSERLIFLDAPMGDVWEYDLATQETDQLTNVGRVLRAHHLTNGDILLCLSASGTTRFDGQLHLLQRTLDPIPAPVPLGQGCWEGLAVSKQPGSTRIAWNISSIDFTQIPQVFVEAAIGTSQIWTGEIVYAADGTPSIAGAELVIDKWAVGPDASIEAQDFRNDDTELVFSAYGHHNGQVMGVTLDDKKVTDYSRSPWYEEPEGIDPAGEYDLVERDLSIMVFPGELDIWQLKLDGSGGFRRVTTFNHYDGYGATNPVVDPKGGRFAFQMEKAGSEHGEGHGLFLFDLTAWSASAPDYEPDPFATPQRL